ncbi:MAG: hypothetical protein GY909_04545 [Oligoflexia bacterium]|nr:hypothetical protein [Oligoflexia bacterium]
MQTSGIHLPNSREIEILNEIGRLKVVSIKELYSVINSKMHYSTLCRIVNRLFQSNLIKKIKGGFKKDYVFLTNRGGLVSSYNSQYDESEDELFHDMVSSFVLLRLLEFKNFESGSLNFDTGSYLSDGELNCIKKGQNYKMALEVELTQKSKRRVESKFKYYLNTKNFDYVLYVFNKRSTFESYKRTLSKLKSEYHEKLILLLDKSLSPELFDYRNSEINFKNRSWNFEELF